MNLPEAVNHAFLGIIAHARGPALVHILTEDADGLSGRPCILELHGVENLHHVLSHCLGHGPFILTVTCDDAQRGNSPRIFFFGIERYIVVVTRNAFALCCDGEIVWDFRTHLFAPRASKARQPKSMRIKFLAAVPVESITAKKVLVYVLT